MFQIVDVVSGSKHHLGEYYTSREAARPDRDVMRSKGKDAVISRAPTHRRGESHPVMSVRAHTFESILTPI